MNKFLKTLNSSLLIVILTPLLLSLFLISSRTTTHQQHEVYNFKVLSSALKYIDKYYVDKAKIDPNQMVIDGLNKLERTINEVLVVFPNPENSSNFTIQVDKNTKTYRDLKINDWKDVSDIMQEVFSFIVPHLKDDRVKTVDIEHAVTDKMLKTLDQYSGIITPEIYNEFIIETEGSFSGLGIVIGVRDGDLTVISPIEGTPAYKAGIKPNDKIVQIENESTINMSLTEAVSKMRGKKGTDITIYIERDTSTETKEYRITRDTIKIESVENFDLENGILYLRIRDFQKNTVKSLKNAIKEKKENISGVILDLRENPGGLLDQAQRVSDIFLSTGAIVTTKVGNSSKSYYAKPDRTEFEGKIVVLVNSGSASASEIVAGALKNNQRAIVIGERTFGKGSVQQIFELKDRSALKLTVASYLTPGNISIQDVGITPDIALDQVIISEEKVIYNSYKEQDKMASEPSYKLKYLYKSPSDAEKDPPLPEEAMTKKEKKQKLNDDFAVRLAKSIIEFPNTTNKKESLEKIRQVIDNFASEEESNIESKWKELGIDWSFGDGPNPNPEILFDIHPSSPELIAGEKGVITVSVKNNGSSPIYRLRAITVSDNPIFNSKELIYGKLTPGQSKNWNIKFDIPKWTSTRNDKIDIKLFQSGDVEIEGSNFNITTLAKDKPLFAYNFEIVDDGRYGSMGNGNSKPENGEHLSVVFNIKNIGTGISPKTIVTLKNLSGSALYLEKGRFEFTDLAPGKNTTAPFLFRVTDNQGKDDIKLEINILDEVFRKGIKSNLHITNSNDSKKFTASEGSVVIVGKNPQIKGEANNTPIIYNTQKGSVFDLLGYTDKYVKIRLSDKRAGWVLKKDVIIKNKKTKRAEGKSVISEIFYSQPVINIASTPLITNKEEINISGVVVDSDKIESISIFKGDDKIKLLTPAKNNQEFSFKPKLDNGTNIFSIVAKDISGLFSRKTITIRKSDQS